MFLNSGLVYVFGNNFKKKLGITGPDQSSPVLLPDFTSASQVVAASVYSLVLLNNGDIYSFGDSKYSGACGAETSPPGPAKVDGIVAKKITAGFTHTLIISVDGKIYVCGENNVFYDLLIHIGRSTWNWIYN
jgi:alpha-tubulin suppressor-like RCC1 family protein